MSIDANVETSSLFKHFFLHLLMILRNVSSQFFIVKVEFVFFSDYLLFVLHVAQYYGNSHNGDK